MKSIVVQCDGISSPVREFDESTPLSIAATPNLDWLANHGEFGMFAVPGGVEPGSDVTHLALLGYDPHKYYLGPAPFEAASLDVHLDKGDVAFLGHFVTLRSANGRGEEKKLGPHLLLDDIEAGGIDTDEARELIDALNDQLASETIQFYTGKRHRHVMVWIGGTTRYACADPRLARGKSIEGFLPTGEGAKFILELMEASRIILRNHPVNQERMQAGLKPANCLWLWGPGKAVEFPSFKDRYGLSGVTLSPDDLHVGIGLSVGLGSPAPVDEERWTDSDYQGLADRCLALLRSNDLVYLHVPFPQSWADGASVELAKAIERFDDQVIGPLRSALSSQAGLRLLVACNPPTVNGALPKAMVAPYVLCRKVTVEGSGQERPFHERSASAQHGTPRDATKLLERLLTPE